MPDPPVRADTSDDDPNEDFIDYNQVMENQATDNPDYPGLPFVPNIPTSVRYFPLMIPNDNHHHHHPARYLYYSANRQEAIGTMGRDLPTYGDSVYLEPLEGIMPQSLGDEQLGHFARDDP